MGGSPIPKELSGLVQDTEVLQEDSEYHESFV